MYHPPDFDIVPGSSAVRASLVRKDFKLKLWGGFIFYMRKRILINRVESSFWFYVKSSYGAPQIVLRNWAWAEELNVIGFLKS